MTTPILLCDGFDVRRFLIEKSNGDESSTEEDDEALFSGDSLHGDVAEEEEEEWCGENRFCFYFVKHFSYDDPKIKAKILEADNEIYRCNTERIRIANRLKAIKAERLSLIASMENSISSLDGSYNAISPHQKEKIDSLSERLKEIELLDAQMSYVLDQRDKAFEKIKILRIQRDKGNAAFFQSLVVMKKAMELAASGDVRDLEELADSEVDKFMSRWNNEKAFRDDYKKRILPSLNERNLRHYGMIRDLDGDATEVKRFSTEEESTDDAVYEKLQKEEEESLKEKKREEQLEKAKLAMERKRKLREKAASRAAIRVKKEAEKKCKEHEKRAKKKKTASNSSSQSEVERTQKTVTEQEKPLNGRSKNSKHRSFRYRHYKKGNETVPKAILKRRRAYRLWMWTVSSAALALPLALAIVLFYIR